MLESGSTLSSYWTFDPLICVFSLSYSFLVFLIMLNFIIAIIGRGSYKYLKCACC